MDFNFGLNNTLEIHEIHEIYDAHENQEVSKQVMGFPSDSEYVPDSSSNDLSFMPKSSSTDSKEDAVAANAIGFVITYMESLKKNQEVNITYVDNVDTEGSAIEEEIEQETYFQAHQNVFIQIDADSQISAQFFSEGKLKVVDDSCDSNHSTVESASSPCDYKDHRSKPRGKRENKTSNPEKNTSAPIMLIIQRMFDGWFNKKGIDLEWTEKARNALSKDLQYRFAEFIGAYKNLKTWTQIRNFVASCGDQEVVKTLNYLLNQLLVQCDKDEFRRCLNTTRLREDAKNYLVGHRKAYYERFVSEIF